LKTIQTTELFNILNNDDHRVALIYGGAGSGKSYQIAIYLLRKFFTEDNISILITRKTTPSLRLTTYKLMLELMDKFFTNMYDHNKTEMTVRYKNNELIFKGLDEASKIRSAEFNYIHMEECSEFNLNEYQELSLRLRKPNSNGINKLIASTNPISIFSWVYTDLYCNPDPSIVKYKSTWKDNPFLDKTYIEELQKLQGNYRKIFLEGEFGMLEGLIFPDFEIYSNVFDTVVDHCYGLDFGYVHKSSLVKIMFLDSGKFIADEKIAASGQTNSQLIEMVKDIIPENERDVPIYCDSAEPARINDMYENNLNVFKAKKDILPGIDYMIQNFLGCTSTSLNLIRELRMYSFQKNQMNELMPKPVSKFDDSICATRYGSYSHAGSIGRYSTVEPFNFR